jgi:hypothetical protein
MSPTKTVTHRVAWTLVVLACAACGGESAAETSVTPQAPASANAAGSSSQPTTSSAQRDDAQQPAAAQPAAAQPTAAQPAANSSSAPAASPAPSAQQPAAKPAATPMAMPTDKPASAPADALGEWKPLVDGAWELKGGEEGYRCARLTASEDLYIKEFQPIAPLGTHHTLLSVNEMPVGPDGIHVCGSAENGHTTLLGSGVGENYSAGPLPEGVAYKIPKGTQLNLNLHLFNTSDAPLKGLSGVRVRTTTADKVKQFAQVTLAGTISLSIPRGKSTAKGKCTMKSDATVFAVSPHMHQLGTHLKAVANRTGSEPVTLYDGPYDFNEQRQFPADKLNLKAGDTIDVECTFDNTTDRMVAFGESSLDEMCFIGLYRYPLTSDSLVCVR